MLIVMITVTSIIIKIKFYYIEIERIGKSKNKLDIFKYFFFWKK